MALWFEDRIALLRDAGSRRPTADSVRDWYEENVRPADRLNPDHFERWKRSFKKLLRRARRKLEEHRRQQAAQ
jgi:hypothetical protein